MTVGENVHKWKVGERVCANFVIDHISGQTNPEIQTTALGGLIDGVLTEYQIFPDYVRCLFAVRRSPSLKGFTVRAKFCPNPGSSVLCREEASKVALSVCHLPEMSCNSVRSCRCAALTACSALQGPKPVKAGDFVLVQGIGV